MQPYKYFQLTRLLEAGLTTRAQDYTRVLGQFLINTAATASSVEQSTFPNWVNNTLFLAEKLKYLVRSDAWLAVYSYKCMGGGGANAVCCGSQLILETYNPILQDPVYTTSSGEISEIGDPEWLGEFSSAVLSLSHNQFSVQPEPQG